MNSLIFYPTLLTLSALFGGMLAFSALFAPLVFIKLPGEVAGSFIRSVFPWYYTCLIALSGLAAVGLLGAGMVPHAFAGAVVCLLGAYSKWTLMPLINQARDAGTGSGSGYKHRFDTLHQLSVGINAVQLLAIAYLLVALTY